MVENSILYFCNLEKHDIIFYKKKKKKKPMEGDEDMAPVILRSCPAFAEDLHVVASMRMRQLTYTFNSSFSISDKLF
jgi:hypothetical protein